MLEKQSAQSHTTLLAAGERLDERVSRRAAEGVHGHFQLRVEVPGAGGVELVLDLGLTVHELVHVGVGVAEGIVDLVELLEQVDDGLNALFDDLPDGPGRIELGLLFEEADRVSRRKYGLAEVVLVDAGQDAQE